VQQRHARFVGAKVGDIQQRVESKTGRITGRPALNHHQYHHHYHQQELPITVSEAYLQVDTRRTGAKLGQHTTVADN